MKNEHIKSIQLQNIEFLFRKLTISQNDRILSFKWAGGDSLEALDQAQRAKLISGLTAKLNSLKSAP